MTDGSLTLGLLEATCFKRADGVEVVIPFKADDSWRHSLRTSAALPHDCLSCGARIPPRDGEGTCNKCDPLGCIRNIVRQWNEAPSWPSPDPYEFMARIASVFDD